MFLLTWEKGRGETLIACLLLGIEPATQACVWDDTQPTDLHQTGSFSTFNVTSIEPNTRKTT